MRIKKLDESIKKTNFIQRKRYNSTIVSANSVLFLLSIFILSLFQPIIASDSVTATKSRNPDGTYSTTPASFTITTAQEIQWKANYQGSGTEGDAFYLYKIPSQLNEILLTDNLSTGPTTGTHYLQPNTYHISINFYAMGPGSYTIIYNRTASISASTSNPSFGEWFEGETSNEHLFTIESTGDLPVTISSVISSDPSHFEIINAPIGQQVPGDKTFKVVYKAGTIPGPFSANITVSGSSSLGSVTSPPITVNGTTKPKEPDVECGRSGTPNLGSADWQTGEIKVFNYNIDNNGNDDLILTGINIVNDTPGYTPFSFDDPPSLAYIPPNDDRTVIIRFAPPQSGGERVYDGHLEIHSNDPLEPLKQCFFKATAHHPMPQLILETDEINFGEVEIGYRFHQAIKISNGGDAELTFSVSVLGSPDPDEDQFILGTGDYSIPASTPGSRRSILIEMTFAPSSVRSSDINILINNSNDPNWTPDTARLLGTGVEPLSLSTMMVIDRSGSMAGSAGDVPKIWAARDAGILYTQILHNDYDWFGITKYNQNNQTIVNLDRISINRNLSISKLSDINGELNPNGSTGIGGGIATASNEFSSSPQDNAQAMIVLTDGKENETPYIEDALPNIMSTYPDLHIFCVGIGNPIETGAYGIEGIESAKLEMIAEDTNAFYSVIKSISGQSRYDLEAFYFKVFAKSKGHQIIHDPTYTIYLTNETQEIARVNIAECDREVDFLILSDLFARYEDRYLLQLRDPTGQLIDSTSTIGGVSIHLKKWGNAELVRIKFPPRSQSDSYSGTWTLLLIPKQSPDEEFSNPITQSELPFVDTQQTATVAMVVAKPSVKVAFMAAVGSDYRMKASLTEGRIYTNQPIHLGAELTEAWWPSLNGTVTVNIVKPDGNIINRNLYDDGLHGDRETLDAIFGLDFTETNQTGYYEFLFRGTGITERGEIVVREARLSKFVSGIGIDEFPPLRHLHYSFHIGSTYPIGDLNSKSDSNIHVRADATYLFHDRFQLVLMFGLNQFTAEYQSNIKHPLWANISINAKTLFPAPGNPNMSLYLQGGPGYYFPKSGSSIAGINIGFGAQIPINNTCSIEFGTDYHHIFTNKSTNFLTFQLGILFR